jgi:hypothetical protein
LFNDTNLQHYFELANFFKDIFKIFFISLKIKQKKQQLTAVWQNAMHFATPCVSGNATRTHEQLPTDNILPLFQFQ